MLIVLQTEPTTAPGEAVLHKQAVAQVTLLNLIAKLPAAVRIGLARLGLYDACPVFARFDVGILEWIDVNGQPLRMLR